MKVYKLICDYCKKEFVLSSSQYAKRQYTKRKTGYDKNVCQDKDCRKLQRQDVIKIMHRKNYKSGHYERLKKERKGFSVVDLYGKEKAKIIRKQIRNARLRQADPRLGKKHSIQSKKKMSLSRRKFLKKNPNISKNHGLFMKQRYSNLSSREKAKYSKRTQKQTLTIKRHSISGFIEYWYGGHTFYESSYELAYFLELNEKRSFWKKNTSFLVSYFDTKSGCLKYQKPDVLFYEEGVFIKLKKIVEVKPYDFLINPNHRESRYYQITKDKKEGLLKFGKEKGVEIGFITERELKPKFIREVIKRHGHEKQLKDLLRRSKK